MLLGYDQSGRCPMLVNDKCSIYEFRPITCRSYDCRIFSATGIEAGGKEKELINQVIRRWDFDYGSEDGKKLKNAITATTAFLQTHADRFPSGALPSNPTQLAIYAIKVYDVLIEFSDDTASIKNITPTPELIQQLIEAHDNFHT